LGRTKLMGAVTDRADYDAAIENLQLKMLRIQQAYFHQRRRAIVVFEGWDASGKGGAIRRLTEHLDPRGVKVWPIGPPHPDEQGRHYLYRFWQRLPEPGTLAIFDRSWYGRVLVERVESLAPKEAWRRAYGEIVEFERMLTEDGVRVVKLFLDITRDEQLRRFAQRLKSPEKRWKLTDADLRSRALWPDYVRAAEEMFARTNRPHAHWHIVPANRKWFARTRVLEIVTDELKAGVDIRAPTLDPAIQRATARKLGLNPRTVLKS
jgi:polyphosphate kinase 2 (PPK2 family)